MDWIKLFSLTMKQSILLPALFVPAVIAFFNLRQAACSILSFAATLVTISWFMFKVSQLEFLNLEEPVFSNLSLTVLTIGYITVWWMAHFTLPKTLFSTVSKEGRRKASIILLGVSCLISVVVFM